VAFNDSDFANALAAFNPTRASSLQAETLKPDFGGAFVGVDFVSAADLLPLAALFSIHPVSNFSVGAVAAGESGALYLGANMEFEGLPLNASLHAEQSAVLNAWMHQETKIIALHVSEAPCGHCRQFLRELSNGESLDIFVQGRQHFLSDLLPAAFGNLPAEGAGLLDACSHEATHPGTTEDLQARAIEESQRSYTPYSRLPEGFAIECADGRRFYGRAAESIAFNPSVAAALTALNQRNLSNSRESAITRAVQAQPATSINNSLPLATALIDSVSGTRIEMVHPPASKTS
jgi:cytidine deaminase